MAEEKISDEKSQSQKEKRLKVLIATDNFLPRWDGISRFLAEMIPRLKKFDITVIAPDFGSTPAEKSSYFRLVKVPMSKWKVADFGFASPTGDIVKREVDACDIIFSQTIGPVGLAVINAGYKKNKKIVSYIHSVEWELVTMSLGMEYLKRPSFAAARSIIRKIYAKVDLLVFPSQSIEELFTWHQVGGEKAVIHLGVDTRKFSVPEDKEAARKKLVIDHGAVVIGYHGRIAREKDLLTLLRAYILVKKQYPAAILLIVGDGIESIKRKMEGVRGVIMKPSTDNVAPFVQSMDIFCLPSLTETTSLTTLEAMSCGVPVIVNKVGFLKEYIQDGKNGIVFKGKDSYDLSKKIMMLIKGEELRRKIGANGRKFVEKEFDWQLTAKKLEETLEKVARQQ